MAIIEAEVQAAQVTTQQGFDYTTIDEGIRDEVRDAAKKIRAYGESLRGSMVAIGKRLQEVKGMLEHGQFEAWIEAEFSISPRTAQNLMNVAKVYGDRKSETISFLPDAVLYALAAPSTLPEVRAEIEQRAADGEHITVADVRESKQAQVEKAVATFAPPREPKAKNEPVRFAPVYELEGKVKEWLDEAYRDGGDRDIVLDALISSSKGGINTIFGKLQGDLIRQGFRHYKHELVQALNNVRDHRRIANAQAEAKAVYVEPEPPHKKARGILEHDPDGPSSVERVRALRDQDEYDLAAGEAPNAPTEADRHAASVRLLTSPTTSETTTLPMSLHWAIAQATDDDLLAALRSLPDGLRKARGPVIMAALKKRGVALPEPVAEVDPRGNGNATLQGGSGEIAVVLPTSLLEALHADLLAHYPGRVLALGDRHTLAAAVWRVLEGGADA